MALLETGVAFVSKNAYIEVAISSKPFCKAAREAFEFLAGHSSDVAILTGATVVLQLLGCFSISAAGAYSTWLIVTTQDRYTNDLSPHYVTDPQFVSGVAFAIASAWRWSSWTSWTRRPRRYSSCTRPARRRVLGSIMPPTA
eukprot:SRR837773.24694.p1 GENE.SRR837773.24694~~SRR837773.24694.p1  ORF type:complete len:149 (-),score=20.74 SRR837773.24694:93-518(-)